ncbi:hypothetical protein PPL_08678 [Heterostelium album PN500]|uniref:Uncharacterized protein n=1 Tax=Heterostelium pallidum (strain ATCC 26659 / Pp 5 / PN500) TaxID=670386 RepID=D3BJF2_HETP5|nr:hypothetical protein PPL_08678 [Heterostelium album PN500]EFA78032.1 hypothetical protein PPL_08678 [Heterostelium album PN500]|eukprot:XP_020430160.1 hypothetical protein PPL_08678 [Heterostelium album PN500]
MRKSVHISKVIDIGNGIVKSALRLATEIVWVDEQLADGVRLFQAVVLVGLPALERIVDSPLRHDVSDERAVCTQLIDCFSVSLATAADHSYCTHPTTILSDYNALSDRNTY